MSAISDFPATNSPSEPKMWASPGTNLASDHAGRDTHDDRVGGNSLPSDQSTCDAQTRTVAGNHVGGSHLSRDTHSPSAAANLNLKVAVETLNDIESLRTALASRVGAAERDGYGNVPAVSALRALLTEAIEPLEHECVLETQRAIRRHQLGAWIKRTVGVGEKQGGRLIAAIGDPCWNYAADRARRGPAELWQYCGHGDPARSRLRRGHRVEFNPEAKMRAHLVAESCIKQMHSPYRAVYDNARLAWKDKETTDMHKHNHALRLVAKAVLRDLWIAASEAAA